MLETQSRKQPKVVVPMQQSPFATPASTSSLPALISPKQCRNGEGGPSALQARGCDSSISTRANSNFRGGNGPTVSRKPSLPAIGMRHTQELAEAHTGRNAATTRSVAALISAREESRGNIHEEAQLLSTADKIVFPPLNCGVNRIPPRRMQQNYAVRLQGYNYLPILSALLLRTKFIKLCYEHMKEGKDSLLSEIAKTLEKRIEPADFRITFEPELKKFFPNAFHSDFSFSEFFSYFFDKILQQDQKRVGELFSVWTVKIAAAKLFRSERLIRLPVSDNLHPDALPAMQARKKPIAQCLRLKCKNEPGGALRCRALLVCHFFNGRKKEQSVDLCTETVARITEHKKTYDLKAVIKGDRERSAYLVINGTWYFMTNRSLQVKDQPVILRDVRVVIYEEVEDEKLPVPGSEELAPTTIESLKSLFEYISDLGHNVAVSEPERPSRGFMNIGNSCYANAVLNCLYYSGTFFQAVMSTPSTPDSLLGTLSCIFKNYQYSQFDLREWLSKVLAYTRMEVGEMQDPRVFYRQCLEELRKNANFEQKLRSLFLVKTRPTGIYCRHSTFDARTSEKLLICIKKPGSYDLEALLFSDYKSPCTPSRFCEKCRDLDTNLILSLGPILVISVEYKTVESANISYPEELDMNRWLEFGGKYKLLGVVNLISDHAVAMVNNYQQWWCFDDERVTQQELRQAPGKPVLLFYEKNQSNNSQIVPFRNIALPSNKLSWIALAAIFYVPEIYNFLACQKLTTSLETSTAAVLIFFQNFQRQDFNSDNLSHINSINFNPQSPKVVVQGLIHRLICNIENSETFDDNTDEVKTYLEQFFLDKRCRKLHKMCSVLIENQRICSGCFESRSIKCPEHNYTLELKVPRRLKEVQKPEDENIGFEGNGYYSSTISQAYKSQTEANLIQYCSSVKRHHQSPLSSIDFMTVEGLDLYTCIKYKCRLSLNPDSTLCYKCGQQRHYTQQFIRYIGKVLVISVIRDEESEEAPFNQSVKFPYHLDLSEFVEGQAKFELKSFICKVREAGDCHYRVTVNVSGSWYTFGGKEVIQENSKSDFYENVCTLLYEKISE